MSGRAGELHLLFSLGADRYALPASEVSEVLPLQRLKQLPEAPAWVAGATLPCRCVRSGCGLRRALC